MLIPREHECSVTGKSHTQVAQLMGQVQANSHKPKHDLNSTDTERQCIYKHFNENTLSDLQHCDLTQRQRGFIRHLRE